VSAKVEANSVLDLDLASDLEMNTLQPPEKPAISGGRQAVSDFDADSADLEEFEPSDDDMPYNWEEDNQAAGD